MATKLIKDACLVNFMFDEIENKFNGNGVETWVHDWVRSKDEFDTLLTVFMEAVKITFKHAIPFSWSKPFFIHLQFDARTEGLETKTYNSIRGLDEACIFIEDFRESVHKLYDIELGGGANANVEES